MTEKRFTQSEYWVIDKQKGRNLQFQEVVGLLNTLHQENQQLQEKLSNAIDIARLNQNDVMEFLAENRKLKEENEQLKEQVKQLKAICTRTEEEKEEYADKYNQLAKELKQKQEEEQLYANEILELREANKEFLQFKSLGGDY